MKNLANCGAREFLKQTAKIRHAVEKWLKLTDIMNIRRRPPNIPEDATPEEKEQALFEHAKDNMRLILDTILDEHPDETMDMIALMCFVDPEHVDEHSMPEYMGAISEMIENEDVMRFFTSSGKLVRQLGLME